MKCGFAVTDITPPFTVSLFGYPGPKRIYTPGKETPLDTLEARALYIKPGDGPGILNIVLDLCILMTPDARYCRERLSGLLGLPVANILIHCTHTHSAPLARMDKAEDENVPENDFIDDPDRTASRYGKWLIEKIDTVAGAAVASLATATLSYAESYSRMGYNRRCPSPSGIIHCWNLQDFPDRVPMAEPRMRFNVLKFDYAEKAGGIIWGVNGIHPVVMGKESSRLSADWPAYARRELENQMPGYQAMISASAGAQVQPWISTQSNPAALSFIGDGIAREMLQIAGSAANVSSPEDDLDIKEEAIPETGQSSAFICLGNLVLVTLPLELSVTLAEEILCGTSKQLVLFCLCNGWDGYWMSASEHDEGGYEVDVARKKGVTREHSEILKTTIWKNVK